jgi:hypothetical protein
MWYKMLCTKCKKVEIQSITEFNPDFPHLTQCNVCNDPYNHQYHHCDKCGRTIVIDNPGLRWKELGRNNYCSHCNPY